MPNMAVTTAFKRRNRRSSSRISPGRLSNIDNGIIKNKSGGSSSSSSSSIESCSSSSSEDLDDNEIKVDIIRKNRQKRVFKSRNNNRARNAIKRMDSNRSMTVVGRNIEVASSRRKDIDFENQVNLKLLSWFWYKNCEITIIAICKIKPFKKLLLRQKTAIVKVFKNPVQSLTTKLFQAIILMCLFHNLFIFTFIVQTFSMSRSAPTYNMYLDDGNQSTYHIPYATQNGSGTNRGRTASTFTDILQVRGISPHELPQTDAAANFLFSPATVRKSTTKPTGGGGGEITPTLKRKKNVRKLQQQPQKLKESLHVDTIKFK